ncbi:hypothetical protein QYE76_010844 [Lolium multiflorum]|uniref:Retrovirus-related Pol polyprotein from transposon TNT 1-94-like beta-barrel domain-containing protein n=1 Tax=Lolium multiflorum TaxID=4521 RepID=A0AAD8TWC0_LOLMU|nr:hypothetical protein QYE76_010844 [Lolium multiflorum]
MITVDVAKANLNMAKTRTPWKIKVKKNKTRNHFLYCGKPNHKENDCMKYKRDLAYVKVANKNEQKGENGTTMAAECKEGEDYLIIEDEECYSVVCDDIMSWVVDSVASFHITSHKEYLTSYTNGITSQVRMGNSGSSTIVGNGSMH